MQGGAFRVTVVAGGEGAQASVGIAELPSVSLAGL
jgi:hypothetical protein